MYPVGEVTLSERNNVRNMKETIVRSSEKKGREKYGKSEKTNEREEKQNEV